MFMHASHSQPFLRARVSFLPFNAKGGPFNAKEGPFNAKLLAAIDQYCFILPSDSNTYHMHRL